MTPGAAKKIARHRRLVIQADDARRTRMTRQASAKQIGVSATTIYRWRTAYATGGLQALFPTKHSSPNHQPK